MLACQSMGILFLLLIFFVATNSEIDNTRSSEPTFDEDGDSDSSIIGCPILAHCQALHRLVISCDATSTVTGCGACISGYLSTKEVDQSRGTCTKSSVPSVSVAASLGLNEDSLVDQLSAGVDADPARQGDAAASDNELQLSARADPAAGTNSTGNPHPDDQPIPRHPGNGDFVFYIIVGTTTGVGLLLIIICAVCWFKYNAVVKQADDQFVDSEFTSQQHKTSSSHPGDGKLALSAQMYHYQHQKQQMMALEKSNDQTKQGASDVDSDLENEDADFTVYECPGLAPTGEMEVRNPLFKEELDQHQQQQQPQEANK